MVRRFLSVFALSVCSYAITACEYEFKEDNGGSSLVFLRDVPRAQTDPHNPQQDQPQKPQPTPEVRAELAPGKDVSGQAALPAKAKRLNLADLVEQGQLAVTTNVAGAGDLQLVFDEVDSTLTKSDGTNPFVFTLEFSNPIAIKAVRILSTYSDYGWALEAQGTPRLVVDMIIDGEWSTMAWPEGMKTNKVKIEVLRKTRDNFVHVNEIEIYE